LNERLAAVRENIVRSKSFAFALEIIRLYQRLKRDREFVVAQQLLRAGTSIGANVEEAQAAQSRRDFISKMSIASKEARETRYWLLLIKESGLTDVDVTRELAAVDDLIRLHTAIVKSTRVSK
jgi:four helix bundle protein